MFYCFFEQSGTFKNEFKRLGYNAQDFDIRNDFGETDYIIDLFSEIEKAYDLECSIFDKITSSDTIIAFFPCIRFEKQSILMFQGTQSQLKNKSEEFKLEMDLKYHKELSLLYEVITKFAIVCLRKKIPLIIENPYMTDHYLARYWAVKPKVIHWDRSEHGDFFRKPTQFFFFNREPSRNMIFEPQIIYYKRKVTLLTTVDRSLISKEYANRFIKEYIL